MRHIIKGSIYYESYKDDIYAAIRHREYQNIKQFIKKGIGPNIQRLDGITPLFVAVTKNSSTLVDLLLEHKANPNLATNHPILPLQLALKSAEFNPKIIHALINAGAATTCAEVDYYNAQYEKNFGIEECIEYDPLNHYEAVLSLMGNTG